MGSLVRQLLRQSVRLLLRRRRRGRGSTVDPLLLQHVDQLVEEEDSSGAGARVVVPTADRDLVPLGDSVHAELVESGVLARAGANADVAHRPTEGPFEDCPDVRIRLSPELPARRPPAAAPRKAQRFADPAVGDR